MPQDIRQKCKSNGNIHTLSNKRISQSKGRKIGREPQDRIVTFNDLDIVRYNRQLLEAERKEKKGDIILNVMRKKDGSQYFLHPYFNSSGSTVFINPEDLSKGFYEKNGKFCYGKTGGNTGNKLKEFKQEEIEELKIKRTMDEEDFNKRINETELNKYFGKFNQPGYTWGNTDIELIMNNVDNQKEQKEERRKVEEKKSKDEYFGKLKKPGYIVGSHFPTFESKGLMYDVIKEPMDNIIKGPMDSVRKKNNYNCTSTLTHESTGTDSNLENLTNSVINQNGTNSLDSSHEDYLWPNNYNDNNFDYYSWLGSELENYYILDTDQAPGIQYDHEDKSCSFSSKPDNNSYYTQTYTPQQISNNISYNTYSNYPYIYDGEYNYF